MAFQINKNSWHFRWIAYIYALNNYQEYLDYLSEYPNRSYTDYYEDWSYRPRDFCSYWRAVLLWPGLSLVVSLLILSLIGALSLVIIKTMSALGFVIILSAVVSIASIVILIHYLINNSDYEYKKPKKQKEPGFFNQLYRVYKDKICPMIEYKKDR
jgi:hypothetical protein